MNSSAVKPLLVLALLAIGLQVPVNALPETVKDPDPVTLRISWDISLDENGRVLALSTRDTRIASAHAELERQIRSWKFSSAKVDGVPVPASTHLRLALEARPGIDSKFVLRLVSADTGPDYARQDAPAYPATAVSLHRQGLVLLRVAFDETGAVRDVQAYGDHEPDAQLAKAARKAVRSWTFSPEVIGGRPRAATAIVPICFAIAGLPPPDCHVVDPRTHRLAGGPVAVDPAVRLESDVIDRSL